MVGSNEEAIDISQEAFVRAYKNLSRFNPVYPFKVWFYKILSNLCKNHLRQRSNRQSVVTSSELVSTAKSPAKVRPDISYEKSETQKIVRESINELPDKFREIIILNHFQEMSYEQIASILDIPHGSVMSRLYYARKKLKEILESKGVCL
jgi:RNA polymerase sigma-70 factor (ECF subfamily)